MNTLTLAAPTHPHHDLVARTIRGWFHHPMDRMGLRAVVRQWGTYWDHGDVHFSHLSPTDLPYFLSELDAYYPAQRRLKLVIDEPSTACALEKPLTQVGWRRQRDIAFLSHVGAFPGGTSVAGLTIVPVAQAALPAFARARLMAFSAGDEEPATEHLDQQIEQFRTQMMGSGQGWLATVNGQAAGMLWGYQEARDVWVNLLGVRLPFRRRGIAHALLKQYVGFAYSHNARSVNINVAVDNEAALRLYHKLGFCDEAYRQVRFVKARANRGCVRDCDTAV